MSGSLQTRHDDDSIELGFGPSVECQWFWGGLFLGACGGGVSVCEGVGGQSQALPKPLELLETLVSPKGPVAPHKLEPTFVSPKGHRVPHE